MKLTYQNNWESDSYFVGKDKIQTLDVVKIKDEEHDVITLKVSVPYNDMGHQYNGVSHHFFVKVNVLGVDMNIDLNTIVPKVEVIPVEYSLVDSV